MAMDDGGSRGGILVVEDEVLVAWDETQILEHAGYTVIGPAHDLSTALDCAQASEPCAAVLDINLGTETVWPLAELLRERGIPILFVTADLKHSELNNRFATSPRLSKPVSEADLVASIASLLR